MIDQGTNNDLRVGSPVISASGVVGQISKVHFKTSVLEYKGNESWIEETIFQIKELLDQNNIPDYSEDCDYCTYIFDIGTVV